MLVPHELSFTCSGEATNTDANEHIRTARRDQRPRDASPSTTNADVGAWFRRAAEPTAR
jgi:hypothetical protein